MENTTFWTLIDASRLAAKDDAEQQIDTLEAAVSALAPDDIVAFDRIFSEYHNRAYDWGLWGAAYLIGGGCSDDGFMDFRDWLISRGEKVYEAALLDPESLADVVRDEDGDCQVEGFQYIARQVWQEKTGKTSKDFPKHAIAYHADPTGTDWDEDDLETLFPKLCEKFF
ncbi:DUF4240 domain-containing protein [Undibacterium sp. Tian12W]|uniref:DUF4240 domain-containing protein n=1 Tax=Undibacterium sp. Tian12W TaxID=3413054 RepID=UPI003BF389DD